MDPDFPNKRMACEKCKHEWLSQSGSASCPRCGHLYVQWKNYAGWKSAFDALPEEE